MWINTPEGLININQIVKIAMEGHLRIRFRYGGRDEADICEYQTQEIRDAEFKG